MTFLVGHSFYVLMSSTSSTVGPSLVEEAFFGQGSTARYSYGNKVTHCLNLVESLGICLANG